MDILRTLTHPLVVVRRGAGPTLAPVLAGHTVTVHLRTVPPLVALRTGAVVATLVVQTGCSIGAWTLLFAFIIVFPTVRTCVPDPVIHTVTVEAPWGVNTLPPLARLEVAFIDVKLAGCSVPTISTIAQMIIH